MQRKIMKREYEVSALYLTYVASLGLPLSRFARAVLDSEAIAGSAKKRQDQITLFQSDIDPDPTEFMDDLGNYDLPAVQHYVQEFI